MRYSEWLNEATRLLDEVSITTSRLDALILLEDVTGLDRSRILAHPEDMLNNSQEKTLQKLIRQRVKHCPLGYLRGKTEFYGREFLINRHVLVPRPETETIIELLKSLSPSLGLGKNTTIIDIGTGSGSLAITAKLELPTIEVWATDIDSNCLEVAQANIDKHRTKISLFRCDLTATLLPPQENDLILLCNLPYVPDHYSINPDAAHEPQRAIFGGPDGLSIYRRLFSQLSSLRPRLIFTESLPFQHQNMVSIAHKASYKQLMSKALIQVFTLEEPN